VGRPLAQRLLAQGEIVVDEPAKLAARVRVFDTGNARKTEATSDARGRGAALMADGVNLSMRQRGAVTPCDQTAQNTTLAAFTEMVTCADAARTLAVAVGFELRASPWPLVPSRTPRRLSLRQIPHVRCCAEPSGASRVGVDVLAHGRLGGRVEVAGYHEHDGRLHN
jgi:hypothetical protein